MGSVAVKRAIAPAIRREFSPNDLKKLVAKAFAGLGDENPLKKMTELDCRLVWSALRFFAYERDDPTQTSILPKLEHVAEVVSKAASLSADIEELLCNDYGEVLNRRLVASRDLVAQLDSFMLQIGGLVYSTGFKKQCRLADRALIYASELVRQRTGTWNDEHLAELLQAMRSEEDDFSGDAIRRKRGRFKARYPMMYQTVVTYVSEGKTAIGSLPRS